MAGGGNNGKINTKKVRKIPILGGSGRGERGDRHWRYEGLSQSSSSCNSDFPLLGTGNRCDEEKGGPYHGPSSTSPSPSSLL